MPVGKYKTRPSKYKPEYCQKIIEYFSQSKYQNFKETTREVNTKLKEGEHKGSKAKIKTRTNNLPPLPTLYGFAASIGVCRDTLYEWSNVHDEFSYAMKEAKQYQADLIVQATFAGAANAAFATLLMKNNFGWEGDGDSKDGNKITLNYKVEKAPVQVVEEKDTKKIKKNN